MFIYSILFILHDRIRADKSKRKETREKRQRNKIWSLKGGDEGN